MFWHCFTVYAVETRQSLSSPQYITLTSPLSSCVLSSSSVQLILVVLIRLILSILLTCWYLNLLRIGIPALGEVLSVCTLTSKRLKTLRRVKRQVLYSLFTELDQEACDLGFAAHSYFRYPRTIFVSLDRIQQNFTFGDIHLHKPEETFLALVTGRLNVDGYNLQIDLKYAYHDVLTPSHIWTHKVKNVSRKICSCCHSFTR